MKGYFSLILGIVFLCTGFGCGKSPKERTQSIVRVNIVDDPHSLDPRKARDLKGGTLLKMLFDGLTRFNPQDVAELAVAEDVKISEDLKTYTFRLKETFWSNGDPVTAFDFAYAWKKALSPDFPSDTADQLYVIKNAQKAKEGKVPLNEVGIYALDAKTFQVELENPTPYFLQLLTFPVFLPVNQKIDEANPDWAQKKETYVGNGPFQMKEWNPQDHLSLVKNPRYWDAQTVKIDELQFLMIHDETELNLFEKGKIDWAGSPLSTLPIDALQSLRKSAILKTKQGLGTTFIRTNTEFPLLKEMKIRKAFALAIDRKQLVEHVLQGNQLPATGLVPPSLGLQKAPYFEDAHLEGARSLFEEGLLASGCTRENLPSLSLLYRSSDRNRTVAQAIQQQWFEALGVQVELHGVELKVYFDRLSKADYQLVLGDWVGDFADPINFLEVFKQKTTGSNRTFWENAEYAQLLDQSSQMGNPEERLQILQASEKILMDEMPIIPLFYLSMLYLSQEDLKDVVLSPLGVIDFKWASTKRNL